MSSEVEADQETTLPVVLTEDRPSSEAQALAVREEYDRRVRSAAFVEEQNNVR